MASSLSNPMADSQSSSYPTYKQHLTESLIPSLLTYISLPSGIPLFQFSLYIIKPFLLSFLCLKLWEFGHPRTPWPLHCQNSLPLGDLNSMPTTPKFTYPDQTIPHPWPLHYLLDITAWLSNEHFRVSICKTKLLAFPQNLPLPKSSQSQLIATPFLHLLRP